MSAKILSALIHADSLPGVWVACGVCIAPCCNGAKLRRTGDHIDNLIVKKPLRTCLRMINPDNFPARRGSGCASCRDSVIFTVVYFITLLPHFDCRKLRHGFLSAGRFALQILRERNGRKNRDDRNRNQKFRQCESFASRHHIFTFKEKDSMEALHMLRSGSAAYEYSSRSTLRLD